MDSHWSAFSELHSGGVPSLCSEETSINNNNADADADIILPETGY